MQKKNKRNPRNVNSFTQHNQSWRHKYRAFDQLILVAQSTQFVHKLYAPHMKLLYLGKYLVSMPKAHCKANLVEKVNGLEGIIIDKNLLLFLNFNRHVVLCLANCERLCIIQPVSK